MVSYNIDFITIVLLSLTFSKLTTAYFSDDEDESFDQDVQFESTEAKNTYYTCYRQIKNACGTKYPEAIDFARMAMREYKRYGWVNSKTYCMLGYYYIEFKKFLEWEHILSPNEWCLKNDPRTILAEKRKAQRQQAKDKQKVEIQEENEIVKDKADVQKYDDVEDTLRSCCFNIIKFWNRDLKKVSEEEQRAQRQQAIEKYKADKQAEDDILIGTLCQRRLSKFGVSKEDAVLNAFYELKLSECNFRFSGENDYESHDFWYKYMDYMIENVKLKENMRSPRDYCLDYHRFSKLSIHNL